MSVFIVVRLQMRAIVLEETDDITSVGIVIISSVTDTTTYIWSLQIDCCNCS